MCLFRIQEPDPGPASGCSVIHEFFHWFIHDVTPWVTGVAQGHPYLDLSPSPLLIAFSESFVGVSFIIPGTSC